MGRKKATAAQPEPAAADFDDGTPLRRRPIGHPAPRYVDLPPGEPGTGYFHNWDAKGRIPPGSILAEFVGTNIGRTSHSGYKVIAIPFDPPAPVPRIESLLSHEQRAGFRIVAEIVERIHGMKQLCVLAPRE